MDESFRIADSNSASEECTDSPSRTSEISARDRTLEVELSLKSASMSGQMSEMATHMSRRRKTFSGHFFPLSAMASGNPNSTAVPSFVISPKHQSRMASDVPKV